MILGDSIFYGNGFSKTLKEAVQNVEKNIAKILGYYVHDSIQVAIDMVFEIFVKKQFIIIQFGRKR